MAGIQIDGVNNKIDFDDDADTSISSATDDTLVIESGGVNIASITSGEFAINEGSADIDFRVESNDDAKALFVDAGNNVVGIGATTPSTTFKTSIAGDGSSIIGGIQFRNAASGGETFTIGHAGATSTSGKLNVVGAGVLRFDTNDTERIRIKDNGIVLIGTSSATNGQLEVKSTTTNSYKGYFANSTANFTNMRLFSDVGGTETETLRIENDGDVKNTNNSYGVLSDERIKQDITDASSQWEDIKALKIKNFRRIDQVNAGLDNKMIGVIAQDLEEAGMSGLVKESIPSTGEIRANEIFGTIEEKQIYYNEDDSEVQNGEKTINDVKDTILEEKPSGETVKSVKSSVLYMKAVKALQEAQTRIETLETKVAALEGN